MKNILLISGTGRNTGKTSLVCKIISHFSDPLNIIALKISPHYHETGMTPEDLVIETRYRIVKEKDTDSGKDSSRMLKAGALESIFIQCSDEFLLEAVNSLPAKMREEMPLICESGSLGDYITPGIHLVVSGYRNSMDDPRYASRILNADRNIRFDGSTFDFDPGELTFHNSRWTMN